MNYDLCICIGTVGYPTFDKCFNIINNIAKKDSRIKDIHVIKNNFPTSKWLNEMRNISKTSWTLQIDEDMYIYDNCIDELFDLINNNNKNVNILNASGLLYDLFLDTNIGSIKMWNTDAFKYSSFKDVSGSDREFAKDLAKFNFSNIETKKVLGEHDSAPSKDIAYFKYKEYILKIRKFQGDAAAKKFFIHFKKICNRKGTLISKFALEGAKKGLTANIQNKTKNFYENKNSEEYRNIEKRLFK